MNRPKQSFDTVDCVKKRLGLEEVGRGCCVRETFVKELLALLQVWGQSLQLNRAGAAAAFVQ